ncbi:MAG: aminotransferase class V-fold PLP-dependent enzyme, partial [Gammaproteobacteria bacterium]|nr:aminotransferase class V-fold PLP-dependent enzyme [Gammaproteobacteria bacterium]
QAGAVLLATAGSPTMFAQSQRNTTDDLARLAGDKTPAQLASDSAYWEKVRTLYEPAAAPIHLEHGNWGMMAKPVHQRYLQAIAEVNQQTSYFGREMYGPELQAIMQRLADELGVSADELAPVRNATEALTALIGGYNKLKPGDGVLFADLDYPSMQGAMRWLQDRRGVSVHTIDLPEPASHDNLISTYENAFRHNPQVRLVLLTHISHRTGLLLPVRDITELARRYNVDVILDSAHAWGQIDFTLPETGADFIGLNLHKWIGAPLGLGLIYIKRDRIGDIDRHMVRGGGNDAAGGIVARTGVGTTNIAAMLAVESALDVHRQVGAVNKELRLKYLRDLWAERLRSHPRVEILTPQDRTLYAGICSFRLRGQNDVRSNAELARTLLQEHNIFTVQRDGLASGACVRATPAVFTRESDVTALADAIERLA